MKSIIQTSRNLSNRFHDRLYQFFYGQQPRSFTLKAKELFKDTLVVGAEIGVYLADNSLSILRNLNIDKLYLIDPFEDCSKYGYYGKNYNISKYKLRDYTAQTVFIKEKSCECLNRIPMLNFCYIDGGHEYLDVLMDLSFYWNKIKPGGIIGGHDIVSGGVPGFGVIPAVTQFVVANKLEYDLYIFRDDWFIIKAKS